MAGIKVRVGQADAIKVLSSADRSSSAFSVSGGTASVTELTVSGHSTLNTLNVTDLATFNSSDNPGIEGITVDGFNEKIKVGVGVTITNGNIFARFLANFGSLNISGDSTFNGLVDINAGGQANTFTVENLTSGRVVLAGTSGQLTDNTNLTFSGSLLSIGVNLDVDGQTDLDVLNVAETATFTGNIDATGNTELNNLNITGIATFSGSIIFNSNIDVGGHTELDNLRVSGVSTFIGNIDASGDLDIDGHTELDNLNVSGISTFASNIDVDGDLDVDGHTELDNLRVSGVSTFIGNIDAGGDLDIDGHTELDNLRVSGVSTFVGVSTFQDDLFCVGTLTAGLIDGGSF